MKENNAELLGKQLGKSIVNVPEPRKVTIIAIVPLACIAAYKRLREANQIRRSESPDPRLPLLAHYFLYFLLSDTDRDNIIGDLKETFPKWVERHGARKARLKYTIDAFTTIYPAALKLFAKTLKFLGALLHKYKIAKFFSFLPKNVHYMQTNFIK